MPDYTIIDAAFVTAQIAQMKLAYPDLAEDADLLADMIDGETDFDRIIGIVTDQFLNAVSMKDAASLRMDDLRARRDRFDRKAEAMRAAAYALMAVAEKQSVVLPVATLSVRQGNVSVAIDNVDDLPQGFTRTEVQPLKSEIKKALEAGEHIPGARLERGPTTLSVRTK